MGNRGQNYSRIVSSGALAVALALGAAGAATAQDDDGFEPTGNEDLYVFGDSLSDAGNVLGVASSIDNGLSVFNLSLEQVLGFVGGGEGKNIAPSNYFKDRFSNGYIWTDYINAYIKGGTQKSNRLLFGPFSVSGDGYNLAHGGAIVNASTLLNSGDVTFGTVAPTLIGALQLDDQARHFRNHKVLRREGWFRWRWRNAFDVRSGDFASISIGGNDYRSGVTDVNGLVFGTISALNDIRDRGVRQLFVLAVPDITLTPLIRSSLAEGELNGQVFGQIQFNALSARIGRHNDLLKASLDNFAQDRNAEVYFVRADRLFKQAIDNPGAFGFQNVTTACLTDGLVLNACPSTTLFYDPFHPTRNAHRMLGDLAIATMIDVKQGNVSAFARTSALGEQALANNQLLRLRVSRFQNASPSTSGLGDANSLALSINGQHSGLGYRDTGLQFGNGLSLSAFSYIDGQINGLRGQSSVVGLDTTPVGETLDFQQGEWIATVGTDLQIGESFMAGALMSKARKRDDLFATSRDNDLENISIYGAMRNGNLVTSLALHEQTADQRTSRFSGASFIGTVESNAKSKARTVRLDNTIELPVGGFDTSVVTKMAYSRQHHDGFVSGTANGLIENTIPDRSYDGFSGYVGGVVSKSAKLSEKLNAVFSVEAGAVATSTSDIGFVPIMDDTLGVDPELNPVGFADPLAGLSDMGMYSSLKAQLHSGEAFSFSAELNTLSTSRGDQQVARVQARYAF